MKKAKKIAKGTGIVLATLILAPPIMIISAGIEKGKKK